MRMSARASGSAVSQAGLFGAILWIRWFMIAMVPVQVLLSRGRTELPIVGSALVVAISYNALLTVNRHTAMRHLNSSRWFSVVDMSVGFLLYATGPYTNWVFFLLSVTTFFMVGVRGRVLEAVAAAVVWNVVATGVQFAWHLPASQVFGIMAIEDLLNLSAASAAFAYLASQVLKLNATYAQMDAGARELSLANERLDEQDKVVIGLMDAGEAIADERDLAVILGKIVGALTGVGFGSCRVYVLEEGTLRAVFPVDEIMPDVALMHGGPFDEAIRTREPVTIGGPEVPTAGVGSPLLSVVVPVIAEGQVLGVLVMDSVSGQPFDEVDLALLALFADQTALAVKHVRLYEEAQDLAVAAERSRITREVQDTVVRELRGAELLADSLRQAPEDRPVRETLEGVRDLVLSSLTDLKFAVLNWDSLEWGLDLPGSVERYAAEVSALTGTAVSVVLRGEYARSPRRRDKDVMRVLQAALSNVWHHAHARTVHVDLTCEPAGLTLVVRDDGRGFDLGQVEPTGGGIAHMQALGHAGNGRLDVTSAPGDGTQVRLWMPG